MAVTVTRRKAAWFDPRPIEINGEQVRIQAKRLTLDERGEFRLDFAEFMQQDRRGVPIRQPGEDALTDEQVWERRLRLDHAERDQHRQRMKTLRGDILAFFERTVTHYVQIVPGDLVDESGQAITTGADLWAALSDDDAVVSQCVLTVYLENTLSEDAKKKLPSWPDFRRSLRGPTNGASGDVQGSTVPNVEPSSAARSEAATDAPESDPSGSMVH